MTGAFSLCTYINIVSCKDIMVEGPGARGLSAVCMSACIVFACVCVCATYK